MSSGSITFHMARDRAEDGLVEVVDLPSDVAGVERCSVDLWFGGQCISLFVNGSGAMFAERLSTALAVVASEMASNASGERSVVEYTVSPASGLSLVPAK